MTQPTRRLFVYGTLRPGEVRWHHLERFIVGEGVDVEVPGAVYDTGLDYPAAVFGGDGAIRGRVYELQPDLVPAALEHLDRVEGAVRGLYRRIELDTPCGRAWAYECGDQSLLVTRIASGDWQRRGGGQNGL